jgi:hypothetical protein
MPRHSEFPKRHFVSQCSNRTNTPSVQLFSSAMFWDSQVAEKREIVSGPVGRLSGSASTHAAVEIRRRVVRDVRKWCSWSG